MIEPTGPNAEQIKYWNETAGPKWVALHDRIDSHIRGIGQWAMDRAGIRAGDRVLDIGCGCGETTLELARRVGQHGHVTGLDISTVMLQRARSTAAASGIPNADFVNADAQVHAFAPASFDAAYSRFGVMFFTDPAAAFTNVRSALRSDGRLTFACWRPLPENPWMLVPLMAAAEEITLPPAPPPDAPGPFSFADEKRVGTILTHAGFVDVRFEKVDQTLTVGGDTDLDAAVEFILQMGPVGAVIREIGTEPLPRVRAAVRKAFSPYHTEEGVRLQGAVWIVTGRAP